MEEETILKPCPHCGGTACLYSNYSERKHSYFVFVRCEICGATGKTINSRKDPDATGWNDDACNRACAAWNLRTEAA